MAALHARCFTRPPPWSVAAFTGLLTGPSVFALTRTGAFLIGRAAAGEAELLTLAVAPEARRRGLARALLHGFETAAARRGADAAFLEVAADNAPAIALYHGAGWREVGRRPGYCTAPGECPVDALIFRRALAAP